MIITLSPAKMMDFKSEIRYQKSSDLAYPLQAKELNSLMKHLSVDDISKLMSINPKQAMTVHHYIHTFDSPKTPQRQAAFAYNGIAYKGLDAHTLLDDDWDFAQNHLIILSGLYGLVRPLDKIKPYRLEMQIKVANPAGKNLYAYWNKELNAKFAERLKKEGNVWINLSSAEYSKVIDKKQLPKACQIITPIFKEYDKAKDEYKMKMVYAKKARGMMTRFIIENKLSDPEHIKAFNKDGYHFLPQLSNDNEWVFVR